MAVSIQWTHSQYKASIKSVFTVYLTSLRIQGSWSCTHTLNIYLTTPSHGTTPNWGTISIPIPTTVTSSTLEAKCFTWRFTQAETAPARSSESSRVHCNILAHMFHTISSYLRIGGKYKLNGKSPKLYTGHANLMLYQTLVHSLHNPWYIIQKGQHFGKIIHPCHDIISWY